MITFDVAVGTITIGAGKLVELITYPSRFKPPVFAGADQVSVTCPGAATDEFVVGTLATDWVRKLTGALVVVMPLLSSAATVKLYVTPPAKLDTRA